MILFLTAEEIIIMHEELLSRWGGEEGGGHRGREYEGVESATQAVKNSYYGELEELAAAYAVYIVQGHVFMDGNKRTGAAAMMTFFHNNGGKLVLSNSEVESIMIELQVVSERGARTDDLIHWLANHLR